MGVDPSAPTAGESPYDRDEPSRASRGAAAIDIPAERPGDAIGPFRLIETIGQGGFGSVWLAERREPMVQRVALKVIKPGMDSRAVIARFEQERQALAVMDHPNVARVFDGGVTALGRPYFVMEYVKGEPITDYCDRKSLSIRERLELFIPVCEAVQHAHHKGIIHRDLKPSNVLVMETEGRAIPKVIDFGIAKATAARLTDKTLYTEHRQMIGTPEYMSPEQAEGGLDIDTRTDVYSLGVLLYELLTGSTPYTGTPLHSASFAEINRIIREVDPLKPSARISRSTTTLPDLAARRKVESRRLAPQLRGELDWVAMKALEKDRARRYETANALAMDLGRYLAGEPVLAAPPSAGYRLRKFVSRHRAAVAGIGAVAAALVIGIVGFAWQAARATRAERLSSLRLAESEATVSFLDGMLSSVDPIGGNKDVSVRAVLDQSARTLDERFSDQPVTAARLHSTIGRTYLRLGLYPEARSHIEKAVAICEKERGPRHEDTARARNLMALLLIADGSQTEAESMLRQLADDHTAWFGRRATVTIETLDELATLLSLQMRMEEAEPVVKEVMEGRIETIGREHLDTIGSMTTLATIYGDSNRFDESEKLFAEATRLAERAARPDHPVVLGVKANHAWMMYWRAKHGGLPPEQSRALLNSARTVGEQVLEARRRVLGEEHHETMTSVNNLAAVYSELGLIKESEAMRRKDLEVSIRTLGEEHPDTITTVANFGAFLLKQNRFEEALPMLEKAVALSRKVLPADSPGTGFALGWHATCLRQLGRFGEAEPEQLEGLAIIQRSLGPEHPIAMEMTKSVAQLYEAWDKAEPGKGHDGPAKEWRAKVKTETDQPAEKPPEK